MSTSDYVEYGGLLSLPAPYISRDTTLYGFWARADHTKLETLCQRVFAEPSGGKVDYRPLTPFVMLTWGRIDRVGSQTPPWDKRGVVQEDQVAIWLPLARVRRHGQVLVAERFAMFVAAMWVDNPMSLATGREVLGYPKTWGVPTFPAADEPARLTLRAFGLNYGPTSRAALYPLLEVVSNSPAVEDPDTGLDSLPGLARYIADGIFERRGRAIVLPGLELSAVFARDLRRHVMPTVFFKQLRSVQDGSKAALQQIAEASYQVQRLGGAPLLQRFRLTVHRLDSHPLRTELGLENQDLSLAFRVKLDFTVGQGRVIWQKIG